MIDKIARRLRSVGIGVTVCVLAEVTDVCFLAGCGSGASGQQEAASTIPKFAGVAAKPSKPAPPLALRDSLGHPVNIDQYRGKAVLVTFIYDHCPDICPLMVGNLHNAQAELGPEAAKVQIIAVSVDPRGDTPKTVAALSTSRMGMP